MDEQRKENYSYSYEEPAADSRRTQSSRPQSTRPPVNNGFDWELFTSWPFIVGAFMLGVWPLGVFLIIKGMNLDAERSRSRTTTARTTTRTTTTTSGTKTTKTTKTTTKKKTSKKKSSSGAGLGLIIAGAILAFAGLMSTFETVDMIVWLNSASGYIGELWTNLTLLAGGCGMLGVGIGQKKQAKRFPLYLNMINSRPVVSFDEIAAAMGLPRRKVVRDLKKMVEKGLFGPAAYLDMGRGCYMANADAVPREEPKKPVEPEKPVEGYDAILKNIRELNDRIDDEELSRQIDRIEDISRKIFREVERNPEKEKQISVLMNYYLPTTQKLLDSYATFEEAGVDGQKTAQAKERIEATMERIVRGFEKQLDELYSADVLDVETDIRVMENMLRRDGADETDELQLKL